MKIIKLTPSDKEHFKLTATSFENKTHKAHPFFRKQGNEMRHYATCPACNNPVQIINLYVDTRLDENANKMPLHARHFSETIEGVAEYIQENYDECPFKNPVSFSNVEKKRNKNKKNELLSIIREFPEVLLKSIREFSKINLSENKFSEMISNFMSMEGYYYRYINKFNLPYSFFYMQKSIQISYQNLAQFNSEAVSNAIKSNSHLFIIKHGRIVKKEGIKGYATMNAYFTNHRFSQKTEFIDYVITEKIDNRSEVVILKEVVEIDHEKFLNTINKTIRLRNIVEEYIPY
ncbi:hypothetical protein [Paenibacillus sp. OK076]|uniref:hypothetical protein n=1 Tax=Paenibacillus sp. OK076 TaxID=1884379 RepID=UPI0008B75E2B|nr:hypothetical protein [Paenibacillus sp. OK076]SEO05634.1 hypothetical protein SAMN05518670_3491 [Paenibacillus sp. OK076]